MKKNNKFDIFTLGTINTVFKFVKFNLIHKLLNQYPACLYLFECFSHGDFEYSHEIPIMYNPIYNWTNIS